MKTTSIFPVHGLASLILMSKHAQSRQFFEGVFRQYILQGWFKMKTTSIFPVHGLPSLILMSKYAQSRQFFVGISWHFFYKAGLRWKLPAYFLFTDLQFEIWFWNEKTYFNFEAWIYSTVYGYFTEANCKYLNQIFVCCFYNITIATMSDNREP